MISCDCDKATGRLRVRHHGALVAVTDASASGVTTEYDSDGSLVGLAIDGVVGMRLMNWLVYVADRDWPRDLCDAVAWWIHCEWLLTHHKQRTNAAWVNAELRHWAEMYQHVDRLHCKLPVRSRIAIANQVELLLATAAD